MPMLFLVVNCDGTPIPNIPFEAISFGSTNNYSGKQLYEIQEAKLISQENPVLWNLAVSNVGSYEVK